MHNIVIRKKCRLYHTEYTILYATCFDADEGIFKSLLIKKDAITSDSLNQTLIINGVRLCKAARYRYLNNNMNSLAEQFIESNM